MYFSYIKSFFPFFHQLVCGRSRVPNDGGSRRCSSRGISLWYCIRSSLPWQTGRDKTLHEKIWWGKWILLSHSLWGQLLTTVDIFRNFSKLSNAKLSVKTLFGSIDNFGKSRSSSGRCPTILQEVLENSLGRDSHQDILKFLTELKMLYTILYAMLYIMLSRYIILTLVNLIT